MKKSKPITKADCDAEIDRLTYILDNYSYTDEEEVFIKKCIKNAETVRDKLASKKESKEANV